MDMEWWTGTLLQELDFGTSSASATTLRGTEEDGDIIGDGDEGNKYKYEELSGSTTRRTFKCSCENSIRVQTQFRAWVFWNMCSTTVVDKKKRNNLQESKVSRVWRRRRWLGVKGSTTLLGPSSIPLVLFLIVLAQGLPGGVFGGVVPDQSEVNSTGEDLLSPSTPPPPPLSPLDKGYVIGNESVDPKGSALPLPPPYDTSGPSSAVQDGLGGSPQPPQSPSSSTSTRRPRLGGISRTQTQKPVLSLPVRMAGSGAELKALEERTAALRGFRVEEVSKGVSYENKGVSVIQADSTTLIRLFGDRFTKDTLIRFVTEIGARGMDCDDLPSTKSYPLFKTDMSQHSALAKISLPPLDIGEEAYYICFRENSTDMPWVHQGADTWLMLKSYQSFLPVWTRIVFIMILLLLSGLFSGLNLGLMSLDRTEMKIVAATGTEQERRYAKTIQPLRDNGNYLLCSLLLGNVMVNSTLTILIDDLSTGLIAVIVSTLSIVILGEIIPQAICSRHGLAVGARTVWVTKFFMAVTFPISYPTSVILDKVLGEEIGNVYNRDRLKELIRVTHDYNDLEKDEINIISGALELRQKAVADFMIKLDRVFMLPIDSVLDFDAVSACHGSGFSRIPIYEGSRNHVVSVLYTKDLAFVDPDDRMPLKTICEFYQNPLHYVFESTTLDVLFRDFKTGNKGHMAFVQRINEGTKGSDPYYEVIGLITLEDVIEALIQAEINDETDVYDSMRRRRSKTYLGLGSSQVSRWKSDGIHVSPQLALAAFQYLSTSVEEFSSQFISKTILHRLLKQNLYFSIRVKNKDRENRSPKSDASITIYEKGKAADYFVLILEGRVQVEMGKENLIFESGPFSFFGVHVLNEPTPTVEIIPTSPTELRKLSVLTQQTFVPDYSVRAVTDVTLLRIPSSVYLAAKQATVLERTFSHADTSAQNEVGDNFEQEIDKMMKVVGYGDGRRPSTSIIPNDIQNNNERKESLCKLFAKPVNGLTHKKSSSDILSEIVLTPQHLLSSSSDLQNDKQLVQPSHRRTSAIMTPSAPSPKRTLSIGNMSVTEEGHSSSLPTTYPMTMALWSQSKRRTVSEEGDVPRSNPIPNLNPTNNKNNSGSSGPPPNSTPNSSGPPGPNEILGVNNNSNNSCSKSEEEQQHCKL